MFFPFSAATTGLGAASYAVCRSVVTVLVLMGFVYGALKVRLTGDATNAILPIFTNIFYAITFIGRE